MGWLNWRGSWADSHFWSSSRGCIYWMQHSCQRSLSHCNIFWWQTGWIWCMNLLAQQIPNFPCYWFVCYGVRSSERRMRSVGNESNHSLAENQEYSFIHAFQILITKNLFRSVSVYSWSSTWDFTSIKFRIFDSWQQSESWKSAQGRRKELRYFMNFFV